MKAKSVMITPALNGFLVKVGCQEVVIGSIPILMHEIGRYYTSPEIVEEEYLKGAINKPGATNYAPDNSSNTESLGSREHVVRAR